MKNIERAIEALEGTFISDALVRMQSFYENTARDIDAFVGETKITCAEGCGRCCEIFLPDVTKLESLYIAAWICFSDRKEWFRRRLEKAKEQTTGPCPLYDFDNPHHCMVYESRGLICRLFGQSCFPDKNGRPTFRNCHLNPGYRGIQGEDLSTFSAKLPVMGNYGMEMIDIEGNSSATEFLPTAVLRAMDMIDYYMSLIFPSPQAS